MICSVFGILQRSADGRHYEEELEHIERLSGAERRAEIEKRYAKAQAEIVKLMALHCTLFESTS